jgi:phospholipid transport system substrate-binding protein
MKIHRWPFIGCLFFLLFGMAPASAAATSPTAAIKGPIDQIMDVLNDPQFEPPEKKADQQKKIWQIARPMFDADALSQRVIGKPWTTFTPDEQSRFSNIFARFLGVTYIEKMQGEYSNVKINYNKELVKGNVALVRTVVMRENLALAIDYRMKQTDGQWKIYDVLVDNGISLVRNYRVQFSSILQKESPAQLILRLEQKLNGQHQDTAIGTSSDPVPAAKK